MDPLFSRWRDFLGKLHLPRGCAKVVPWWAGEASVNFDVKLRSDSDDIRYHSHSPS